MLLNETIFYFFQYSKNRKRHCFSSSFSDQRRRPTCTIVILSADPRHWRFAMPRSCCRFFLLTMFNSFKPCVRSASEVYCGGRNDLTAREKTLNSLREEKRQPRPNYIITKWGIFLSDYQFSCCGCLSAAQRALVSVFRVHALSLMFGKSQIQCHFICSTCTFPWMKGLRSLTLCAS